MGRPSSLPAPAETLTLRALKANGAPMTAYALLEALKPSGVKSPPIVYRALDALVKTGKVHRVNALGAYVACACSEDHTHALTALLVCDSCGDVEELHDGDVMDSLTRLREQVTLTSQAVIELPALCKQCGP